MELITLPFHKQNIVGSIHDVGKECLAIISHGFTGNRIGNRFLFVEISRHLEKCGISSARFDFIGSGESDGAFTDTSLETNVEQIKFLIRHFKQQGFKNIALIGYSFGGVASALVASEVDIHKMILIAAAGDAMKQYAKSETPAEGQCLAGPLPYEPTLLGKYAQGCLYPRCAVDTLIIHGDQDENVEYAIAARYAETLDSSSILRLPNSDHGFNDYADRQVLLNRIQQFLTSQ